MWKYLFALVATVVIIGGSVLLYPHRHTLFSPDFDRVGGTLLVYDVEGEPSANDLELAATRWQQRLDPNRSLGLRVSVGSSGTLEIRVPTSDKHDAQVEQVKRVVVHGGQLDVRILANAIEDGPAFTEAMTALQTPNAKAKVPPPKPILPTTTEYQYEWARVGAWELKRLKLDPLSLSHHNPGDLARVKQGHESGEAITPLSLAPTALFAVRETPGEANPVFFVLTKLLPEPNRLTNRHIQRTAVGVDRYTRRPAVTLHITRQGEGALYTATSNHLKRGLTVGNSTQFAVLLDGEVISTPAIVEALAKEMQLTGDFTPSQVEDLAVVLRGESIPVRVKAGSVRESSVGKK
jgi:preprotein translocase subunit SecD